MFAIPFHSDTTVLNTRPPTLHGSYSRTTSDRDQALLNQVGRLASNDASSAVGGEGSIRSGRAGSIASSQAGSTGAYSYTARALQEQQQLMANRIMMGGSSWDSAEDVIVSLKFLQPFVKAGEADAMLVANSIPNSSAGSGGDFAFTHPNPFAGGGSDEPPKTASSHATSVASSKRSTGSTSLTAMESEVYGILKMYVENKLKKKRGGKEKRMIEVGKKIEVLEDEFPDCATYIKLFKRVREIHDLPPRETPASLEPEMLQQNDDRQSGPLRDRNPSSASFIDPFDSLPRTAPRYTHHHTASTSSSLSRQVSPAASVSLGAAARPPTRKLSKRGKGQGHESKPSTSSHSSQSSISPSVTADDIFVNFGLNEVDPGSTSMANSANTNPKAGKRPSMSLFTTFGSTQKKRSETVEAEISWPLPSPTIAGKMTSEQEQAEVVKAKIAEAFLEGVPGRERKVSALGDAPWAASRSMPVRPPRPGLPATSAGGHRSEPGRTSSSQVSGTVKVEHKDDIDVRDSTTAKATVDPKSRPSSGSSSNRVLRSVASASAIRIDQPVVVSDTFEADIFGSSPEKQESMFERRRDSQRSDTRSIRITSKNLATSTSPPPMAPLPALPDVNEMDSIDRTPLPRSRSNSISSTQSLFKRQAVFMSDENDYVPTENEVEELVASESSSVSDNSSGSGRRGRSAEEIMSALQARTSAIALPGIPAKDPLRPAPPSQKHSSWSRASAGRLCDLPEEGEEAEDGSPRSQARAYNMEDSMASPALSTRGNRYSTDSYDLKITTPEGDISFQTEYRRDFDAELGSGFAQSCLEQELFFRAPAAKRDSAAIRSNWK